MKETYSLKDKIVFKPKGGNIELEVRLEDDTVEMKRIMVLNPQFLQYFKNLWRSGSLS